MPRTSFYKILLFFIAELFVLSIYGQVNVCFYDIDANEGVIGAGVLSANNELIGYTNSEGCIIIDTSNVDTIVVDSYFYKRKRIDLNNTKSFKFYLESKFNELKTVTISSSKFADSLDRVPQSVEVFSSKKIVNTLKSNAADVLEESGKVYVQKSQLGGGSPILRGFEANRVLLVVDGIRMNNAIYRSGHLQNIMTLDPLNQDQIDVVYGPASAVYGSDAIGGTIHFHSKKNEYSKDSTTLIKGNLYSHWGSAANEKRIHGLFSVAEKRFSNITSFSFTAYGDLLSGKNVKQEEWLRPEYVERINGQDIIVKNDDPYKQVFTGYQQMDASTKFGFKPNEKVEHIFALQFSNSSDVPRYDRLTQYEDDTLKYARWDYGPQSRFLTYYKLLLRDSTRFYDNAELLLSYQNIKESRIDRKYRDDWENNRNELVNKGAVNLNFQKFLTEKSQLQYGAELSHDIVTSTAFSENIETKEKGAISTRYPDGGSTWSSAALYGYYKKELKHKMYLDAGARLSYVRLYSKFDDTTFYKSPVTEVTQNSFAFNWTLGLTKMYQSGWTLAALTSSGFRAPNVDDVGKVFDSQPGNVIVPNADLKPEKIYNFEMRIKREKNHTEFQFSPFISYMVDMIVIADYELDGQDSIIYDGTLSKVQASINTGKSMVYGASFFVSQKIIKFLKVRFNMTYTYGEDLSSDLPLGHIPPVYGAFSILHSSYKWRLRQEVKLLFNSNKGADLYNPDTDKLSYATPRGIPSWMILNYRVTWQLSESINVIGRVENIFDLHYRTFSSGVNAPGRNFQLGIFWAF